MTTKFEYTVTLPNHPAARRRSTTWVQRLAVALIAGLATFAPTLAIAVTFDEVMQWCSAPRVEGDEKLCSGYITAVLRLLNAPDATLNGGHQICLPAGDVRQTILPVVVAWRRQHPEANADDPVSAIGEALAPKYSCK